MKYIEFRGYEGQRTNVLEKVIAVGHPHEKLIETLKSHEHTAS